MRSGQTERAQVFAFAFIYPALFWGQKGSVVRSGICRHYSRPAGTRELGTFPDLKDTLCSGLVFTHHRELPEGSVNILFCL